MLRELAVALLSGREKAFPFSHLLINCGHWELKGRPEGEYIDDRSGVKILQPRVFSCEKEGIKIRKDKLRLQF